MNLKEKLSAIQTELKAPKNLTNKFGGYNYRNADGICEAVKPYLKKYNVALVLDDFVYPMQERYYIQATAKLIDCESDECIEVHAMAREAETKKGMDDSQLTGSTSSYARKYALNGLFLLDDTKDADSEEFKTTAEKKAKQEVKVTEENINEKITDEEVKLLKSEAIRTGTTSDFIKKQFKVKDIKDLTNAQYHVAMNKLLSLPDKKEEVK